MKYFLMAFVWFYKRVISPLMPHVCIYTPSCSSYMLEALKKHGAIKGVILGTKRILRCNPWALGGFDPVPDSRKDTKWLI